MSVEQQQALNDEELDQDQLNQGDDDQSDDPGFVEYLKRTGRDAGVAPDNDDEDEDVPEDGKGKQGDAQGQAEHASQQQDAEPFPGFSKLPAEAQQHYNKLQHAYRAQQGQLAPTQQKVNQLIAEVKNLSAEREKMREQLPDEARDNWKQYETDFPDEAKAIAGRFGKLESELGEARKEASQARELVRLSQIDPNWSNKFNSPEFQAWAPHMTDEERRLFRNMDADSAAAVLRAFDADYAAAASALEQPQRQEAEPKGDTRQMPAVRRPARAAVAPTARTRQSAHVETNVDLADEDPGWVQFLQKTGRPLK